MPLETSVAGVTGNICKQINYLREVWSTPLCELINTVILVICGCIKGVIYI